MKRLGPLGPLASWEFGVKFGVGGDRGEIQERSASMASHKLRIGRNGGEILEQNASLASHNVPSGVGDVAQGPG